MDEKLLADLCECYLLLTCWHPYGFISTICILCLLKVASNKEESDEVKHEVEMALLALSNSGYYEVPKELHLNEIKEIILHHQEHQNLTRLAYQRAWEFMIIRLYWDNSLKEVIVNELHFGRESTKELEELMKCVDWNKNFKEMSKEEANEVLLITGWMKTIKLYFDLCGLRNEEFVGLIGSIVQVLRASRCNNGEIYVECIHSISKAAINRAVKVDDLLKGGAINAILEEIHRSTLDDEIAIECLRFFIDISRRLKDKEKDEKEDAKRKKTKRKVFEWMEEEGYEDCVENTVRFATLDFVKV
ncbi:uncharacterized protein MONOS_6160 [Monocercomonoides exilis]|uniref:uncharacterized protein n=1 Tax=Monocercomonoides exilis TaxID=2049356 RepID=UPI00355A28AF|nr:hypothetical protein MONOS_6160 [Monocercomonoides exilis]|eukprot:MONOS_6160.1-p1 / transcript=MONOS_6160.1 / gene=MONOS_6160 / organism=Monocercomonoides_exilis_PA203 / gene_product=unspecified product / transcript_product=unspecified product / location=Mono_scaffold00190:58633-59693(-) / protein_length=303 / sequence_SO=supercontig / SO=protein_coding / is_pseudo=false